ncbi:MAG: large subunit ribosomal protein [Bacteroidota bacterium]|nr:large subunit ribosomal protein [Bacteroidota bacterium]
MIDIIKKPVVTEKAMKLGVARQYAFIVNPNANKIEIKKAIEEMFEVQVQSVRTVRVKGKQKSRITRKGLMRGKTSLRKKAYITLKEGHTIDIVSGAAESE